VSTLIPDAPFAGQSAIHADRIALINGEVLEGTVFEVNPVKLGVVLDTGDTLVIDRALIRETQAFVVEERVDTFKGEKPGERPFPQPAGAEYVVPGILLIQTQLAEAGEKLESYGDTYFLSLLLSVVGSMMVSLSATQNPPDKILVMGGCLAGLASLGLQVVSIGNIKSAARKLRSVKHAVPEMPPEAK
jgi:hypothetical protein